MLLCQQANGALQVQPWHPLYDRLQFSLSTLHRPGHNATNTFTVALLPVITKTSQCMSKLQQATAVNFFLRNSV